MSELYPWLVPTYNKISQTFSEGLGHHALLIKVDQGLGVESLFDALTKRIMCQTPDNAPCGNCHACHLMIAQSHPDFHVLASQEGKDIGVDQVRARRALQEQQASPPPGRARHCAEGLLVGGDLVEGKNVDEEGHPIGRLAGRFRDEEGPGDHHLREHERKVLARASVIQTETLIHVLGRLGEKTLVVGARHHHVNVVVPGNETPVANRPDGGSPVDRVRHPDEPADTVQFRQDQRQKLVHLGQVTPGCRHKSSTCGKLVGACAPTSHCLTPDYGFPSQCAWEGDHPTRGLPPEPCRRESPRSTGSGMRWAPSPAARERR